MASDSRSVLDFHLGPGFRQEFPKGSTVRCLYSESVNRRKWYKRSFAYRQIHFYIQMRMTVVPCSRNSMHFVTAAFRGRDFIDPDLGIPSSQKWKVEGAEIFPAFPPGPRERARLTADRLSWHGEC
jgi:hypothetical protein